MIHNDERKAVLALSELSASNPFLTRRIDLERDVLGDRFVYTDAAWHKRQDMDELPTNIGLMTETAGQWSETFRERLIAGESATPDDLRVYEDVVTYYVYNLFQDRLRQFLEEPDDSRSLARCHAPFYAEFRDTLDYFFADAAPELWADYDVAHLFACFYQLRRAFHYIHGNILGGSMKSAELRASVWHSIFTHDMRRYRRSQYRHMTDIGTLILGSSGTGKELVAQAIGYSRFIPFDETKKTFIEDYRSSFYPVNLSALSPTLIESELFGHRKGSFTGAIGDRVGWFGQCSERGSVFLDEIGETSTEIQVKLLRLLQSRTFQRVGDSNNVRFHGKIIAATNRDLAREMQSGAFREDLYYRLCGDLIRTPDLADQIQEAPEQLHHFVLYIARSVAGYDEAPALAEQVEAYIENHLGPNYPWPGNVRELEQCVRSILIRQEYHPTVRADHEVAPLGELVNRGEMKLDELSSRYISMVYARTKNYQETARRLGLDGRTVKTKVKDEYMESAP